ncbi:hypothetical protein R1sor_010388 [Riccia sorocarpa]|uniref:ABC transporter domain-containing protein n=1 Tax=Riccia sorocarpa TaxID=122646 RepID=A0ABD3I1L5_9MARC
MAAPVLLEGGEIWADRRSGSASMWSLGESVFSRSSTRRREDDDEEALKWAALEKLPTYDRLRTAILKNVGENGTVQHEEIDVTKLGYEDRQHIIEKILKITEEDNERFLLKLRDRIDRVGIDLPKIEVRFENLKVDADVYVGHRALPSLINWTLSQIESIFSLCGIKKSSKRTLNILTGVSGIVKPTRMTLLLGPPGSGKTTLLLALAGKLPKDLKASGRITYNGHAMDEFVPQRTSAYISQHDLHIGELTVRETLDFSGRCQGVGTRYEMLTELSRREKEAGIKPEADIDIFMKATSVEGQETSLVTDYTMKLLGLDVCADTLVGDDMRRGVSGGQKKRLTTGEMMVGPAKALFMDEISTGLDSSKTFQIIKCLRQFVHVMDSTMLVSLLQPSPETYELFDDIILLSEGQIVYQGPCDTVLDFFSRMGFRCPERKGVADFLQEVTSMKDQEQYWANRDEPYTYVSVSKFAEAFSKYHVGQCLADELDIPYDKTRSHPAALVHDKYALNGWELLKACFVREQILLRRNSFVHVFKAVQVSIVATITMTVFLRSTLHQRNVNDGNLYLAALFFALLNSMFNGFAELAMIISRLPVFYKQRDLLFYPSWAFSLPIFVTRIPFSLLEGGIWVTMTYFVIGFAPEAGRFLRLLLLLVATSQMALGLFRFIGSVGRTMVVAQVGGSFALLIILILGGFVIAKENIPAWWIWGYWISPLMYGQQALSVNEFLASRWDKPYKSSEFGSTTLGKAILKSRSMETRGYWYWLGVSVLFLYAALFNIAFTLALKYLNPPGQTNAVLSEEALEEKHANRTGEEPPLRAGSLRGSERSWLPQSLSQRRSSSLRDVDGIGRRISLSSVLSGSDNLESGEDHLGVKAKRGMVLPFKPLALAFNKINYYVDMPVEMKRQGIVEDKLQLLRDVSGAFRPGVLTALVGVSGAGKTTLMDVLAGRKTEGYIEGSICISGFPKKQATFARISGYCEQTDIHSPNVTVHESIAYSAWLRLSADIDAGTRRMFVEEVMELVELTPLRDSLVGLPGQSGLSTEQRKRLTIAVELVANPSIIFMDEPTSGLDARAAAIVMRAVRNTVDTGRTVVCTIHQPSIDIFESFDELLLMKRGGQVIYAGRLGYQCSKLIEYFEAVQGVPKIKEGYNAATWMLEVTSISAEAQLSVDFAEIYQISALYQRNEALVRELSSPSAGAKDLEFPTAYSQPYSVQFIACLWKLHLSYWRNPLYNAIRFFFTTVCAFIFGSIFWGLGRKRSRYQDLLNLMGSMYASVLFLGVSNSSSVQPVVGIERTVFYRERAAGMYAPLPYAFAQFLVEWPYVLVQSFWYATLVYSSIQLEWTAAKFFWYIYFMFFTLLYFTYWGMMTVAITPNGQFAAIISSAFYGLWNLFSGFLITRQEIPAWWKWYYWLDPVSWSLYGLLDSQLGDVTEEISLPGGGRSTIKKYLEGHFGFHHDFLVWVAVIHLGLVVLFGCVFAICIKYLNFQRR